MKEHKKTRYLDSYFINDLQEGQLTELLDYVKRDNTLDLEIRDNEIHIYYRGGKALGVKPKNNLHDFTFDYAYLKACPFLEKDTIKVRQKDKNWNAYFPIAKQAMDFYFSKHGKEEREFQQLVVRENNYSSIANSTDYFVIDIEYDNRKGARFDIIACEWPSVASKRSNPSKNPPKLAIIEKKYGDGALKGKSGMNKHCEDFNKFIANASNVYEFKQEMIELLKQKRKLGLIPGITESNKDNNNDVNEFAKEIDLIFLIANHKPAKSVLKSEIESLKNHDAKFITSNFMGYGIYHQNIFNQKDFLKRFLK